MANKTAKKSVNPNRIREEASQGGALGSHVGRNRYLFAIDDGVHITYIFYELAKVGGKVKRQIVRGARPKTVSAELQMAAQIIKKRNVPNNYWTETF